MKKNALPWRTQTLGRLSQLLVALLFTFSLFLNACTKSIQEEPTAPGVVVGTDGVSVDVTGLCKSDTVPLYAGQTILAGYAIIGNDGSNLYITVHSDYGYQNVPENIKIWVGDDLATLPVTPGGISNGQFPFKKQAQSLDYTFTIPFSDISTYLGKAIGCNSRLYVFIHADVIADGSFTETAWAGDCTSIAGLSINRWFRTLCEPYQIVCCTPPPPPSGYTQTAFAKGGWVFTTEKKSNPENLPSLMLTRNRWGWAVNQMTGSNTYDLWAGAGLNNIAKGTKVGTVTVNWDGANATVTYNTFTNFSLAGIHVYCGDEKPTTIAPGQYGNTASFDPRVSTYSGTYPVTDLDGDGKIWVIAHAGVYGPY